MNTHCKFSASSAYRWLECPASVALSELAEPEESSVYAEEGTRAHELLYAIGTGNRPDTVDDYEMLEHVENVIAFTEALLENDVSIYREQKFLLSEDVGGTADIVIHYLKKRFAIVIDMKYGLQSVKAIENPQLAVYATAVAETLNVDTVHCHIVQPRIENNYKLNKWIMDSVQLVYWKAKILTGVQTALEHPDWCNIGSHCRYCAAKAICPAILQKFDNIKEMI